MSHDITPRAYETKLGNLTAKSVLALIADQANVDGFGWPSMKYIADRTEVKLRTVLRMVEVFVDIGLVSRSQAMRYDKVLPALQINLEKLGTDLREVFEQAYARAQAKGKNARVECRSDTAEDVAETLFDVAETLGSVAATLPPHPLKGRTVIDPLLTPSADAEDGGADLDPEQLAHLERCRPEDRRQWESYYREENRKAIEEAAEHSRRELEKQEREAELRRKMPTLMAAVAWVFGECRFVRAAGRDGVAEVMQAALVQDAGGDREFWRSAAKMAVMWQAYRRAPLRWRYGPEKFIATGAWLDKQAWPWEEKKRGGL